MQVVKITPRGNSLGITIPRAYLAQLRWGTGDLIVLQITHHHLEATLLRNRIQPPPPTTSTDTEPHNGATTS